MATKNFSFENAMAELEETVRALEEGKLILEESLKAFERGVKLVNACNEKINQAEKKVKILLSDENGDLVEKDFDTEKEEF
jgi:exodeoxyribonuclease VII small subunit